VLLEESREKLEKRGEDRPEVAEETVMAVDADPGVTIPSKVCSGDCSDLVDSCRSP
jgi:hypothetical protein